MLGLGAVAAVVLLAYLLVFGGVATLVDKVLHLPAAVVITLVFLLPALESSIFLGVVFPGEIAVLVGGVCAAQGRTPIAAVLVAASLGAVLGDQVGYVVGREWGVQVLRRVPDRLLDDERLDKGRAYIRRLGAKGVVLGRWTAALRAIVPGLAGMARMHYTRFLIANVVGGVVWAVAVAELGYAAGDSYKHVQKDLGHISSVLLALVVVFFGGRHLLRRRRARDDGGTEGDAPQALSDGTVGVDDPVDEPRTSAAPLGS